MNALLLDLNDIARKRSIQEAAAAPFFWVGGKKETMLGTSLVAPWHQVILYRIHQSK
jgi:hypothetical protein